MLRLLWVVKSKVSVSIPNLCESLQFLRSFVTLGNCCKDLAIAAERFHF
jgi:hypothetical protein